MNLLITLAQARRKEKDLFPMSMFRQCPKRKKGAKKNRIRHKKSLSRITLTHQDMPKSPWSISIRPKGSHRNTIKSLTQAITRVRKGKGPKCTTHSNVLWRIAPHIGLELWDFCHSCKTKKTSISERIRY